MTTPSSSDRDDLAAFDPHATYGSGAQDYDDASRDFWSFASQRTVDRLSLPEGAAVLDVACGPGWSALAAAERVGETGQVTAVDISEQMLTFAQKRARARGLNNIEFVRADMTEFDAPESRFDAVVCVLGIFFVEDMVAQLRKLWSLVSPSGRLAVTNLGPGVFAPLIDAYRDLARDIRPDLSTYLPWERTNSIDKNEALFAEAAIPSPDIRLEEETLPLTTLDDGWRMVIGSGLRRFIMEMSPRDAETLRTRTFEWVGERDLDAVQLDVIYCVADRS